MAKVHIQNLKQRELRLLVAAVEGAAPKEDAPYGYYYLADGTRYGNFNTLNFYPDCDPSIGQPLIEKYKIASISLPCPKDITHAWRASLPKNPVSDTFAAAYGATQLEACMRALVAANLADEHDMVELPGTCPRQLELNFDDIQQTTTSLE